MTNNGKKRKKVPSSASPRKQRMVCLLSEEEAQIRWFRETVLTFIHQKMEEDYPTLFKEHDMRR